MPAAKSRTAPRRRASPKNRALAPIVEATLPGELEDWWYTDPATGAKVLDGVVMQGSDAMRISTVSACVRLLADTVASLPCKLYRSQDNGKSVDKKNPLYRLLHDEPNQEQTAFEFWEYVMTCLLLRGNFYAIPEYGLKSIKALWPVSPDNVKVKRIDRRTREYDVRGDRTYLSGQIVHIMGLSLDGIVGVSPIEYNAATIGLASAMETSGVRLAMNGSQIRGVLKHPAKLGGTNRKDRLEEFRRQWSSIYSGPMNAGRVAILEEGMEFQPIAMTNQDAQWIETRKYQRTEICAIFRVPPHMIGDLERATFSNIEHQAIEFEKHSIRPWLVRIERALKRDLLSAEGQEDHYVEFQADALLRGDSVSRTNALSLQFRNGAITLNEWRSLENRNPIEEEIGDLHFVPRDLATWDQIEAEMEAKLNPPEPEQPPAPPPDDEPDAKDAAIEDAATRLHRAEKRGLLSGSRTSSEKHRWAVMKYPHFAKSVLELVSKLTHLPSDAAVAELRASCVNSTTIGTDERLAEIRKILEASYAN